MHFDFFGPVRLAGCLILSIRELCLYSNKSVTALKNIKRKVRALCDIDENLDAVARDCEVRRLQSFCFLQSLKFCLLDAKRLLKTRLVGCMDVDSNHSFYSLLAGCISSYTYVYPSSGNTT